MADVKLSLLCAVCGDKAAGYHFGVFSCEGCKSFFGRAWNRQDTLRPCRNDKRCIIHKKHRTVCQTCRFQKCVIAGMSKENSCFGRRSISFKLNCLLPAMLEALQKVQAEDENLRETYFTVQNLVGESISTNTAIQILKRIVERQKNSAINIRLNRELNLPESSRFVKDEEGSSRENIETNNHPDTLDLLVTLSSVTFSYRRTQEFIIQNNYPSIIHQEQTEPLDLSLRGETSATDV